MKKRIYTITLAVLAIVLLTTLTALSTLAAPQATVSATDRLKAAETKMKTVNSAKFTLDGTGTLTTAGGTSFTVPFNAKGAGDKVNKTGEATGSLTGPDGKVHTGSVIGIGDTLYVQDGTTGTWYKKTHKADGKTEDKTKDATEAKIDPYKYLSNVHEAGVESINGVSTHHIQATLDWAAVAKDIEAKHAGATAAVKSASATFDVWVGEDNFVYQAKVSANATVDTAALRKLGEEGKTAFLNSAAPAGVDATKWADIQGKVRDGQHEKSLTNFAGKDFGTVKVSFSATLNLSAFNQPVTVTAPANAISK